MSEQLILIAKIIKAFGVRGAVKIRAFVDNPQSLDQACLRDEHGKPLLNIVDIAPAGKNSFIIHCKEQKQREEWQDMRGVLLYLRRDDLPKTAKDEFYASDLIGCSLLHQDGRKLGIVRAVHDFGAGEIIETENSIMLPFTRTMIPDIDLDAKTLITNCPDAYLGQE